MALPITTNSSPPNLASKQTGSVNQRANTEQFLTFSVSPTQKVMLPTRQLVEILNLSLGQITSIADVSPTIMGVCNWRGEVLWVVDLASLTGFEPLYRNYSQSNTNVILARSQGLTIGLAVSQIGQMLWCDLDRIMPAPASFSSAGMSKFLRGYWLNQTSDGKNETYLILNADAIVTAFQ
jgi:positive phototaxis protein PixI